MRAACRNGRFQCVPLQAAWPHRQPPPAAACPGKVPLMLALLAVAQCSLQ
jgi:hypothetical protein